MSFLPEVLTAGPLISVTPAPVPSKIAADLPFTWPSSNIIPPTLWNGTRKTRGSCADTTPAKTSSPSKTSAQNGRKTRSKRRKIEECR